MLASYFDILPLAENLVLRLYSNQIDDQGLTALIWVVVGGHEAIVTLLLENGADIEGNERWGQPVITAAENGHGAIVRLL